MGIVLIALLAFVTRASGAKWNKIPCWAEITFAALFTFVGARFGLAPAIFFMVWTYFALQTGHGNFYQMKGVDLTKDEPEHLEWLVRKLYHGDIHTPLYSWICMGVKGLAIGLALFPLGLLLAVLWPAAYFFGIKLQKNETALAEILAGASAGLVLWLAL